MLNKKKERGYKSTASYRSSILPKDLLTLNLLKLPMRSITCCKCVCKSWRKLISHPSFRNSYMSALPSSSLPTCAIYRKWRLGILYDPLTKKKRNTFNMLNKKKKKGNKSTASYSSSILPEELVIMILLKLPMRSITCCKCVCKSWQKLISDASFRNSYMSALPSSFLPSWAIYRKWPLEILYDPLAKETRILLDPKFDGLPKPLLDFFGEKVIPCASSHGLLCCSSETTTGLLYICNPMTREFKALPVPDEQFDFVPFAGFSYSPSTGRFMVAVRAWHTPAILVFTSPFGGWRKFYIHQGTCRINPVLVGHRLYFLLRDGRCMTILDTQEEKWNIIILPVGIDGRDASVKIVRWDDYVCLVKICGVDGLVVWILSEENEWGEARRMEARWLPELNDKESFIPLDVCGRFLYVIGGKMLFIYDLEWGILKVGGFTTHKIVTACETFAYKPTLYSITL